MKISTTRFGDIDIDESGVIHMKEGLLGFEHLKKYKLFIQDEKIPFWWLQSVEDGSIAFVVINSLGVKPDYEPVISEAEVKLLEIESLEDTVLLSVVTIRYNPLKVTANLRAPIVVNTKKMLAKQLVLVDSDYPVQYPVTENSAAPEGKEKPGIIPSASTL
ncbi:MAG: flagellar assembly protein FliW [Desulfobacterales bacterium]|nr:flagellar assembly protein FliW [Desulfobacterales bacterium]